MIQEIRSQERRSQVQGIMQKNTVNTVIVADQENGSSDSSNSNNSGNSNSIYNSGNVGTSSGSTGLDNQCDLSDQGDAGNNNNSGFSCCCVYIGSEVNAENFLGKEKSGSSESGISGSVDTIAPGDSNSNSGSKIF